MSAVNAPCDADPSLSDINVEDAGELRFWTEALGIHADQLYDIIKVVGTSANAVRAFLKDASGKRWCA